MKIKYLKSENATITIEYSSKITKFFEDNLNYLEESGIERIYIKCSNRYLKKLIDSLEQFSFNKIYIFIKIFNYQNQDNKLLKKLSNKYCFIICDNTNLFTRIDNIKELYYEISFNYLQKNQVIKIINKYDNIILNCHLKNNKLKENYEALDYITAHNKREYLLFDNLFIAKHLIIDCPYNIYLNNENSHRDYGNMIPRNLYIDNKLNVYCTNIKSNKIIMGNLKNNALLNILQDCKNTKAYKYFIDLNKKVFIEYLNQYPFTIIDWISFLSEVIKDV